MARSGKNALPYTDDRGGLQCESRVFQAPETQIKLSDLPIGARLLVRSRSDWRTAAVSRFVDETQMVVLTVSSPSGHSYRLRRDPATQVIVEGGFAILPSDFEDSWRDNFSAYDRRW